MSGKKQERTKLKQIPVYVTDEELEVIRKLADIEKRSMSNLGKVLFMERAKKMGLI